VLGKERSSLLKVANESVTELSLELAYFFELWLMGSLGTMLCVCACT